MERYSEFYKAIDDITEHLKTDFIGPVKEDEVLESEGPLNRYSLGIITLIILLVILEIILYLNYHVKMDSYSGALAALAAFLGVILSTNSITSWGKKQKAEAKDINDKADERLKEKELELAAEIVEAFHKAKQSLIKICSPLSTGEEEQKADNMLQEIMKNPENPKRNPRIIKRGLVFVNRWNTEVTNINHLISLKIKVCKEILGKY